SRGARGVSSAQLPPAQRPNSGKLDERERGETMKRTMRTRIGAGSPQERCGAQTGSAPAGGSRALGRVVCSVHPGECRVNRSPESPFRKEDSMRPYVLSVALVLLGLASTPATAAALAPSKPSQLVNVAAFGTCPLGFTTDLFDTLVKGDGTKAPFSIPAGE